MPHLGDFEAWVEVDQTRLPEYRVEPDGNGPSVRCWIPSEEGKTFVIHWKDKTKAHSTGCHIYIDGSKAAGGVIMPGNPPNGHYKRDGRYISETHMSLFQFGSMTLTDDESLALEDEATLKALGTIELCIWHGSLGEAIARKRLREALPAERPVHEKMKKAGGHRLVSGEVIRIPHSLSGRRVFELDDSDPIKFIFQYRPKGILQALDIMPRDKVIVAPKTLVAKREIEGGQHDNNQEEEDEDTAAKIRQLEKQLAALRVKTEKNGKKAAVKKEPGSGRPAKAVKKEESQSNATRLFASVDLIDLT